VCDFHQTAATGIEDGSEEKQFFFEKKNQKTFAPEARSLPQNAQQIAKSFCFFSQKEVLSCFLHLKTPSPSQF
jgi:hypothetical protein